MKQTRHESDFQNEIQKSFSYFCNEKGINGKYYKPPDDTGHRNPHDGFFMYEPALLICLELKIEHQKTKINFKSLFKYGKQYHQIQTLIGYKSTGHKAMVLVNHFIGQNENFAYALCPHTAKTFYEIGSIDIKTLRRNSISIPRIKGSLWDLSVIF